MKVAATAEAKAKIDAARTQLKAALAKIKDVKKKKAAENLNGKFSAFNKQMTDHFVDVLGKLKLVLGRIEDRTGKAEGRGVKVADVKTAIENAKMAIAKADDAVKAQAAKIYTITVTNEKNLGEDMKKTRQQLRDDLDATRNVVKDAREAVRKAAVALAKAEPNAEKDENEKGQHPATTTSATSTEAH